MADDDKEAAESWYRQRAHELLHEGGESGEGIVNLSPSHARREGIVNLTVDDSMPNHMILVTVQSSGECLVRVGPNVEGKALALLRPDVAEAIAAAERSRRASEGPTDGR